MENKVIWKSIAKGKKMIKMPFGICQRCNKEYQNNNVFASKYCPECALIVKKEKTRERVRKHRKKPG